MHTVQNITDCMTAAKICHINNNYVHTISGCHTKAYIHVNPHPVVEAEDHLFVKGS